MNAIDTGGYLYNILQTKDYYHLTITENGVIPLPKVAFLPTLHGMSAV